ncbi:MAG: restriction endonuclease subunit S [Gammaproteobacteria bacterium]|nr:restriction endonuclease subunit S [Gammaproteobacteria bacterium]
MKAGWETVRLADVCTFRPPKSEARKRLAETDIVSFAPMEDLGVDQKYFKPSGVRPLGSVAGSYTYFADGDVLLAKITPCFENGKLGIARDLENGIGFGSSEYFVIRPSSRVTAEYLYYFLSQPSFREAGAQSMTGAVGHKRVAKDFLEEHVLPLPPPPEQQRIVAILDEAFAGIATARAAAEQNRQNARALFESHLQSIFSQRGEGWVDKTLGDVCELFQGLCINAKTKHLLVESSNLPLLRIKDLRDNSSEQYVAEAGWPKNAFVTESEIIYTRTGQIGLVFRGRRGVLHNNCFKVTPSNELNDDYLFWWLQSPAFRARITTLASKAAQPDISHALFKIQPICLPPRSYQDQAIPLINQIREETQNLEALYQRKLDALDELKQSLLHQAFSGKL